MKRILLICGFLASAVFAQNYNSFQGLQPQSRNYQKRASGLGGFPGASSLLPNAPSLLTAVAVSSTTITIDWVNNAPVSDGQIVQRCAGVACTDFQTIYDIPTRRITIADVSNAGLLPNTSYSYRVMTYLNGKTSTPSNTATAVTEATPTPTPTPDASSPIAPSGLSATSASASQINLAWTDNASNETGFRVERCSGIGCELTSPTSFAQVYEIATPNTQVKNDTGLNPGVTYCYQVNAYNANGPSAFSNSAGDTTATPTPTPTPSPPTAPSALGTAVISSSQINLTWTDNSSNETVFKIERCAGVSCSSWAQVATASANAVAYSDTGLAGSTSYSYRIRASNGGTDSAYTSTSTAVTSAAPNACASGESLTGAVFATCLAAASGNLTSEVGGIVLTQAGSPTYSVANAAPYDVYTPGITFPVTAGFGNTSAQAALDLGTGDFDFFWVGTKNTVLSNKETIYSTDPTNIKGFDLYWYNPGAFSRIAISVVADTHEQVTYNWNTATTNSIPGDGLTHIYELRGERAGNLSLYIDNVLQAGTPSMAAVAGKTVTSPGVGVGSNPDGTNGYGGTLTFLRHMNSVPVSSPPTAPTNLAAVVTSYSVITLSWTDNSSNETGFKLERCTGAGCSDFAQVYTPAANAVSQADIGRSELVSYSYRLRATGSGGDSSYSNTVTAETTLGSPSSLSANTITTSRIDLAWLDNSANETGQTVQRCSGAGCSNFADVYTPAANATTQSDTGLTPSTSYSYRAKASYAGGSSDWSNTATAVTTVSGACGSSETTGGSVAAWCLGEASGAVLDTISSISLATVGAPTYAVTTAQVSPIDVTGYSPGITIPASAVFYNASAQSTMNPGTGDFNVFWVGRKLAMSAATEYVMTTSTDLNSGYYIYWNNTSFERIGAVVAFNSGIKANCTWNSTTTNNIPGDTNYHTYEIRFERAASMNLYIDGTLQSGGCSMAGVLARDIVVNGVYLGALNSSGGSAYNGTINFVRQKNTLN